MSRVEFESSQLRERAIFNRPLSFKERLALISAVSAIVSIQFLNAACGGNGLGKHDVPFINSEGLTDTNGNGLFDEVRDMKGPGWMPGIDVDFQRVDGEFKIDGNDIEVLKERVCTLPVRPQDDKNRDGYVTDADVERVADHLDETYSDEEGADMRFDALLAPTTSDGKPKHRIPDDIVGTDPFCTNATSTTEGN